MNKQNVILIICGAIAAAIIICAILLVLLPKNSNSKGINIMKIEKYNENFEVEKTVDVKNNKDTEQLLKACKEEALSKDGVPQNLAIRNDFKVDMKNGTFFMIQQDLKEYCYYENTNTGVKMIVKMPEGLIEYINSIFES